MRRCLAPIPLALFAGLAPAQAPAGAAQFAHAFVASVAPAVDDPDAAARDALAAAAACRTTPYASNLADRVQGLRERLQRPGELLPVVEQLLQHDDLHGMFASQLRWLRYRLLLATGRAADAARVDPAAHLPRSFRCTGPFGRDEDHFVGVPFAPELETWTDGGTFACGDASRGQHTVRLGIAASEIDAADPADPQPGCWYALHRVEAPNETQCYLALWSRGALEVFVNGQPLVAVDPALGDGRTDHVVPVGLAAGQNHVLVKTCGREHHAFDLAYVDARWAPLPELREVPAEVPLQPPPAPVAATLPPYADGIAALQTAAAAAADADRAALRITAGLLADRWDLRETPLAMLVDLQPRTAVERLAAAQLWRALALVPEEIRNAEARTLEEAAGKDLDERHFAMLRARIGLLEEQDQRERALDLLHAAVRDGRAGPDTFRLLLQVADRARFAAERQPILNRWCEALPHDPEPRIELAKDCQRAGAMQRAAALAGEALRLRPDLGTNLGTAWRTALDLGDTAAAAAACELVMPAVLEGEQRIVPLLWQISTAQRGAADVYAALLERAIEHREADARRLRNLVDRALARGLDQLAVRACERILATTADDFAARRTLSHLRGEPEPGAAFARFRHDGDAAIAAFTVGDREDGAPATVLVDQRIVEVFADGSRLIETHELRRLNDQSAVEQYGESGGPDDADEVLLLRTVATDGDSYVPAKVGEARALPRLEPGVFVEWRYRDFVGAPADGNVAVDEFLFCSMNEHLLLSELVLIRPQGLEIDLRDRNLDFAPETIDLGDGREALRWTARDVARLTPENSMPALADIGPVVAGGADGTVTGALRAHRHDLLAATRPTPPIRTQVATLLAGIDEPSAQLQALHAFCQREIAPQRSRSATETLMRKKGNAHTLLLAMLRAADFTLEPARCESIREELITGEGELFYDPTHFYDLDCVRVVRPGLVPVWLFGDTPRHWPVGKVPAQRAGGGALVLTDRGLEQATLPPSDDHGQMFRVTGSGTLSADQLEADVELTLGDLDGYRAAEHFQRRSANERRQFARQFAQGVLQGWQVQKAEIGALEPGQPVSVTATVRRRGVQADGDRLLLPLPLPSSRFLAMAGTRPDREVPLRLTSDVRLDWDLRLELDGLAIDELPDPSALQSGALTHLQEVRRDGNALVLRRRATLGSGTVEVAKLPDWLRLLQQVERVEGQSLAFRAR
ncbi:MAG: hypothetical protein JNL08_04695 [Planctomycetes bacterium]|nr:hypothetical protein [Planctomycetota bacterium]